MQRRMFCRSIAAAIFGIAGVKFFKFSNPSVTTVESELAMHLRMRQQCMNQLVSLNVELQDFETKHYT